MRNNKVLVSKFFLIGACIFSAAFFAQLNSAQAQTAQKSIARVEQMANVPQPLQIIDYKALAEKFDRTVYDFEAKGDHWPLIWMDNSQKNFAQPTVGIFTAIGDVRQGTVKHGGTFHEAVTSMGAVLGATLVGIDKSKQQYNYVGMLKNYFNRDTEWNIMQNNTNPEAGTGGGGYARDWWYDVFPNVLFYGVYDKYPNEPGFNEIAKSIADKFYAADQVLNGNYMYSFFNYKTVTPQTSWICPQPDAAAGHAYVMYSAYKKFGDAKYLAGSKSAMDALSKNAFNPSYEVLMPFGALLAARMNAEEGTNYDVSKMLDWSLNGQAFCRMGWGAIVGRWNGTDVSGIIGSATDHEGHGFLMNTYDMAWPLLPMVRYDQAYARTVGKWMLNAANAARLFYPEYVKANHQTLSKLAGLTKGVIAYEGIARIATLKKYVHSTVAPVSIGDGPAWAPGMPEISQFSVYGSAHVGIFGSTVQTTNVLGVLKLNLLATDFFRDSANPTYLYFNPYVVPVQIQFMPEQLGLVKGVDLYDTVRGEFIARDVSAAGKTFEIAPDSAAVIVVVPSGQTLTRENNILRSNDVAIDYHAH